MKIDDIKDLKIEYRDKLDINPKTTIGMEIEFQNAKLKQVNKKLKRNLDTNWIAKYDATVCRSILGIMHGGEINSPILRNSEKTWEDLQIVCNILTKNKAEITEKCGGHIHIGKQLLNEDSYMNFIKLWYIYEPIIYRFSYGEFNRERESIFSYAASVRNIFRVLIMHEYNYKNSFDIVQYLSSRRRLGINFQNIYSKETIEFRCPNSSLDPVIWQNNVNFFAHLLDKANNVEIDEEKIQYILRYYTDKHKNVADYTKIDLNNANELANIVFDNEIDKLYFLRQYIKNGEEKRSIDFTKSKKFTK